MFVEQLAENPHFPLTSELRTTFSTGIGVCTRRGGTNRSAPVVTLYLGVSFLDRQVPTAIVFDEKSLPTKIFLEFGPLLAAENCVDFLDVSFTPDPPHLLLVR